jgi:ABC-type uncharacterized transport system auxiliary subunit
MKTINILLLILLLSACSSAQKKVVDKTYYRFPEPQPSNVSSVDFLIKRPSALGILGNRPMVAENKKGGLTQMNHNFWLESPKVLLQNYLGKLFVKGNQKNERKTLNSQILHLEKKQDMAILAIKFELIDAENKVLFTQSYQRSEKLNQNTIASFVKTIYMLLDKITLKLNILYTRVTNIYKLLC